MSNNNAVNMDGSGNPFSRILKLNMAPPGIATILLAYKLQTYGAPSRGPCSFTEYPPNLSTKEPLTKPLTNLASSFSSSHRRPQTPPRA